jgi:hypothetical protein
VFSAPTQSYFSYRIARLAVTVPFPRGLRRDRGRLPVLALRLRDGGPTCSPTLESMDVLSMSGSVGNGSTYDLMNRASLREIRSTSIHRRCLSSFFVNAATSRTTARGARRHRPRVADTMNPQCKYSGICCHMFPRSPRETSRGGKNKPQLDLHGRWLRPSGELDRSAPGGTTTRGEGSLAVPPTGRHQ